MVYNTDRKRNVRGAEQKFAPIASAIRRKSCAQNVMQSVFWGLKIEISRKLISGLENMKISLLGTVQQCSVVYMLNFFVQKKCGIAQ